MAFNWNPFSGVLKKGLIYLDERIAALETGTGSDSGTAPGYKELAYAGAFLKSLRAYSDAGKAVLLFSKTYEYQGPLLNRIETVDGQDGTTSETNLSYQDGLVTTIETRKI